MFSRDSKSDLFNVKERLKELTEERDNLFEENKALRDELYEMQALSGGARVQVARMASGGDVVAARVPGRFSPAPDEGAKRSTPLAVLPAPELESPFQEIAELAAGLRAKCAVLAQDLLDRTVFEQCATSAKEMCRIAALLGSHPVASLSSGLDALFADTGRHSGTMPSRVLQTGRDALQLMERLLTQEMLAIAETLAPFKVIAVDDDKDLLPVISASLEFANLTTTGCPDARSALDTLQENHCDLILLDIGLPDMDGVDMCSTIRALPKHGRTPILFLTGDDSPENRERSARKGASDLLGKPFNMFELALKAHTWALKIRLGLS